MAMRILQQTVQRRRRAMKVKDLIKQLNHFDPNEDIVLKEKDGRETPINLNLRVYKWEGRTIIDGYNRERKD